MKQAALDLKLNVKKTRKREFLEQMERVIPWDALVTLIAPYYPEGRTSRPPFALETMLRVHFLQQWFSLSDPAIEEAFFDVPLYREFAQLDANGRMPDESTMLLFRHRLEKHKLVYAILATVNDLLGAQGLLLRQGSAVDATLIAAPSSTKNKDGKRDPEMHSSKKGDQWHFGMKAHIAVDADSNLVHAVRGTAGHVADVTEGNALLHGEESVVHADAGYQGADRRPDAKSSVHWSIAMRLGKRRELDKAGNPIDALIDKIEKCKAGIRAKVEHPSHLNQAPVRVCESALPGFEEKHAVAQNAVCAVKPVDGTPPTDGCTGMSALKNTTSALNRVEKAQTLSVYGIQKVWIENRWLFLNNIRPVAPLTLSYSDLP